METPADAVNEQIPENLLQKINAYWRVANYLSVGQIYLQDNPLMKEPLKPAHKWKSWGRRNTGKISL